ncbi:MAG TPA: hypothetical protein VMV03_01590, partial [Spirochaetia bacterium]|nr:hypothetical protein [Spirochaetia bacterium]
HLSWAITLANPAVVSSLARVSFMLGGGARGRGVALAYIQGIVEKTALVNAIDDVFIIASAITLAALMPALFLKKVSRARRGSSAE